MRRSKKKKRSRTGKLCITCMVVVLMGILSFQIVKLYHKDQSYQEQQAQLEAELQAEQERSEELEEQQEYVGTDEYVEDVARSRLGMVYPDEILFKEE